MAPNHVWYLHCLLNTELGGAGIPTYTLTVPQFTCCLIQGGLLEFLIQKQLCLPLCLTTLYFCLFCVVSTQVLIAMLSAH